MAEKDETPTDRYRNDPDPRRWFADVFINGEPMVSEPLRPESDRRSEQRHPDDLDAEAFLEQSDIAHPMRPEDRLPEGEIQATFGKRIKGSRRRS